MTILPGLTGGSSNLNTKRTLLGALAVVVVACLLGGAAGCWYIGGLLSAPQQRAVGEAPPELNAHAVSLQSESGFAIRGWYSPGERGKGAVLILHGVGANRSDMLSRASFLHRHGYAVLLIDFQAHGESGGTYLTFGDLESKDAAAAVAYLRGAAPGERVGIIGVSLGAASAVLADPPLRVQAVVLEAMYPTIDEAIEDRLRLQFGSWGPMLSPLLLVQMQPRLGVSPKRLRPIDHIADVGAPLLLIHGAVDQHTTIGEARRVFAAAAEPKAFWEVPGAAHVDIHRFATAEYEQRVSEWLSKYLRLPVREESPAAEATALAMLRE